ncbi:MAG: hypothetical protein ACI910_002593 [Oleispira sp.]
MKSVPILKLGNKDKTGPLLEEHLKILAQIIQQKNDCIHARHGFNHAPVIDQYLDKISINKQLQFNYL